MCRKYLYRSHQKFNSQTKLVIYTQMKKLIINSSLKIESLTWNEREERAHLQKIFAAQHNLPIYIKIIIIIIVYTIQLSQCICLFTPWSTIMQALKFLHLSIQQCVLEMCRYEIMKCSGQSLTLRKLSKWFITQKKNILFFWNLNKSIQILKSRHVLFVTVMSVESETSISILIKFIILVLWKSFLMLTEYFKLDSNF